MIKSEDGKKICKALLRCLLFTIKVFNELLEKEDENERVRQTSP